VKRGIINRVSKGIFSLKRIRPFTPEIDSKLKSLHKKIIKEFPFLELCLWNTSILNEFTIHQTNQNFIMVEVEKGAAKSIFIFLKEQNMNVFFKPSKEVFDRYITENEDTIIVKSLITEAPVINTKSGNTVSLEKVLVDIFCDDIIFTAYQGNEMKTIYKNAISKYSLNQGKLLRYASRRGKKEEIKDFTNQIYS